MIIFTFILIFIVAFLLGAGLYLALRLIHPHVRKSTEVYGIEVENGNLDEAEYEMWPKREVVIQSPGDYPLFGIYFPAEGSHQTVMIVHGFTYGLYGSVKYTPMFRRRNFNILLVDLRHHGRSGGSNITWSYKEKDDLAAWTSWVLAQHGKEGVLGTLGESLGGATVLQHAAIDPRVAFTIADCPFSDMRALLVHILKTQYRLPPSPLLELGEFWCRVLAGFNFSQASPLNVMGKIQTPVLLIHGEEDTLVPAEMSRGLFEAKTSGSRGIRVIPGAGHAEAFSTDPAGYEDVVSNFVETSLKEKTV
jgi:pimeloyl-ACP methyl ester carboxylesterase